jgi:hypothetical protein
LVGDGYGYGAGAPEGSVIFTTATSGYGHILPSNNTIDSIELRGPRAYDDETYTSSGPDVDGLSVTGSVIIKNSRFILWRRVATLVASCYYGTMIGGEIDRCEAGFMAEHQVFNFSFNDIRSRFCNNVCGSTSYHWENLKFIGGSVEGYSRAFNSLRTASFFGTYFETFNDVDTVIVFNNATTSDPLMSLTLDGCLIFMNHTDRFINYSGYPAGVLTTIGNHIEVGTTIADDGASHIFLFVSAAHTGKVCMLNDSIKGRLAVPPTEVVYINNEPAIVNKLIF